MRVLITALGAFALSTAASAQQQDAASEEDLRVNQLIIYGEDTCPPSTQDEITVCARLPEDERYRIPPNLRENPNDPANQSWSNRAIELSYIGRSGIGSCSPTGPGGMIGCQGELISQFRAERAGRDEINWSQMIEEARQERLSGIDAESEAIEAELREDD